MAPIELTAELPEEERKKWQVIDLSTLLPLPGWPICVYCDKGIALMQIKPKEDGDLGQKEFSLGPNSLRLIRR